MKLPWNSSNSMEPGGTGCRHTRPAARPRGDRPRRAARLCTQPGRLNRGNGTRAASRWNGETGETWSTWAAVKPMERSVSRRESVDSELPCQANSESVRSRRRFFILFFGCFLVAVGILLREHLVQHAAHVRAGVCGGHLHVSELLETHLASIRGGGRTSAQSHSFSLEAVACRLILLNNLLHGVRVRSGYAIHLCALKHEDKGRQPRHAVLARKMAVLIAVDPQKHDILVTDAEFVKNRVHIFAGTTPRRQRSDVRAPCGEEVDDDQALFSRVHPLGEISVDLDNVGHGC